METDLIIRETLKYLKFFRGETFIIKMDGEILPDMKEQGIFQDIKLINDAGIQSVIVLPVSETDLNEWQDQDTAYLTEIHKIDDFTGIKISLVVGKIAVIKLPDVSVPNEDEITASLAIQLDAAKLIFVTNKDGLFFNHCLIKEATVEEAERILNDKDAVKGRMLQKIQASIQACLQGVKRVHIINGKKTGILLEELFTCRGRGTMIYKAKDYTSLRRASPSDTNAVFELLKTSLKRYIIRYPIFYREILKQIENFVVFEVDGEIHGCATLRKINEDWTIMEYLVSSVQYDDPEILHMIFKYIVDLARQKDYSYMFIEADKNPLFLPIFTWFPKQQFEENKNIIPPLPKKPRGWIKTL